LYKISLINMPFANLSLPSIALTQLKTVIDERFGPEARVRILYLNQDLAHYLGLDLYEYVTGALQANNSGLGDWMFRQVAFPDLEDNTALYFRRYFSHLDASGETVKGAMLAKRAGLKRFMERLVAKYQLDQESLVGFTSMFAQNVSCFAMARLVKSRNPAVVTVMGGANCEAPMGPELVRHVEAVDFVFSGPALVSFPQLVQCELQGDRDGRHAIRGVFSRSNVDSDLMKGHGAIGEELPIEVPVALDYESFLTDLERNFPDGRIKPSLTFETSRGCWWGERSHCTFCGLNGGTMKYRSMPTDQALALFHELFEKYGGRCSRFESVDNIMPRQYLKEVFPQLTPPPGVSIFYEVKADVKEWEMEILSAAGVTQIQPGIEALASSTLKLMGKGTTSFQNLEFLKNCLRFGIRPSWNLLIGFPREEEEVYQKYLQEIPLLAHLPPPSGAFPIRFDRYSPYFTRAGEYGLDLVPYEFYGAIYPFGEEALKNIAYYFEDRNYNAEYLVRLVRWQDQLNAAVERWRRRWHGADGAPKAQLRLEPREGRFVVLDTRAGGEIEHPLSDLGLELLSALRCKGLALRHLIDALGTGEPELAAELAHLRELGLLFEENERFISLVLGIESAKSELESLVGISREDLDQVVRPRTRMVVQAGGGAQSETVVSEGSEL
jgi:ribosomal peptide maturation radical SAM protein 1